MNKFLKLSDKNRSEIFEFVARKEKIKDEIIEKDFWVTWVLYKIFTSSELDSILIFKGGTSLSKVFNQVNRFSEDIDLVLNMNCLKPDFFNELSHVSRSKIDSETKKIKKQANEYLKDKIIPVLKELLYPLICEDISCDDGSLSLKVVYPIFKLQESIGLVNGVLLEISPMASSTPFNNYPISSIVAEHYPALFDVTKFNIPVIELERTFWEKVTILHQEANRPVEKLTPSRYSRHYYDVFKIYQSKKLALCESSLDLLRDVIDFKQKFYFYSWAGYDKILTDKLKLFPNQAHYEDLKNDYESMKEMIYDEPLPLFEEILGDLLNLESEINKLIEKRNIK